MPKFFPKEYNGFDFKKKGRNADFTDPWDWNIGGISTKNSERLNERPEYSGTSLSGVSKALGVYLNNPDVDRDELVIAMDCGSNVQRRFYVVDELGDTWYVMAKATKLQLEGLNSVTHMTDFLYILDIDDPSYISVKEYEDIWNVELDEELHTITIGGNQNTNPVITVIPGEPIDYYPFSYWVKNFNPIQALQEDAIDITNGGWDTATLVTAGDMLANGDDVRVIVDGVEVPRWFGGGGMDSASTKIYIRAVWKAGSGALLKLRTLLSGVTTPARIEFVVNATVKAILATYPISGVFRVGNEEISYRNLNATLCQADIVKRPIRGTSIAAHSVNDVVYWVEHDIRIIWGNAGADAPVYDERFKPQWDLATGSNSLRNYNTTSGFADTAGLRAGAWKRLVINDGKGNIARTYSGAHAAIVEEDPADVMGMEIPSYQVQGKAYPDTCEEHWLYGHPAGLQTVEPDGEKFRSFANTQWSTVAPFGFSLESSPNSVKWTREWFEDAPAAGVWEEIDHDSPEALPTGTKFIRFHFNMSVNGVADNFVRGEIDEAAVQLISANVIQVGFIALEVNYQLVIGIANLTTGDTLYIDYPAAEGIPFVIDTENFEVTYDGLNAINGIFWNGTRTRWLKFVPGPNDLQFLSAVGSVMQISTVTHKRAM